jgi:hypothetical protein
VGLASLTASDCCAIVIAEQRLVRIRSTQRMLIAAPECVVLMLERIGNETCEKLVALKSRGDTPCTT